ncbi:MAG: ABC transporter ATP-binding protein [Candidatus Aenigmarchaeota archaeon]|nr:ABC transporter ATP-binding protein [Candidatus Aenigmarchaeota archaeon]
MDSVISLENVGKVYRNGGVDTPALSSINLKIGKGDFASIMGPSGSGKSTLLHIIGALDKPSSGKVIIDGKEVSKLKEPEIAKLRGEKIGFVFQFFNLYPTLTALENVELPMVIAGKEKKERVKRAKELLEMVGLKEKANSFPSQLSGGQKQRVAIARALANNPLFVLADEPTGNLDSKSGKDIIDILENLNKKEGKTVVIITHDQSIASHSKHIIRIEDGRIVGGAK